MTLTATGRARATEAPMFRQQAIERCDKLTDQRKFKQSEACIAKLEKSASGKELRFLFYSRLTSLLMQEKLTEAQAHVDRKIAEVKDRPDSWECWLYNAANWVAWMRGDLRAAVQYTEGMRDSMPRHQIVKPEQRGLALHYLWDHAYLLLDLALSLPPAEQAEAIAKAEADRAAYHQLADPEHEADGLAVLDAYFALRQGRGKEALERVAKVERSPKGDLQDQYIVALALEAGGDIKGAEALRKIIRTSKNVYPMKAVIVRQLALDKQHSPIKAAPPATP